MNAFARRGACPALSSPMPTGDGLLVRLNPLAGGFSPASLIALCKAALQHGNGVVEVTARGSLQIRGLTPRSAALLARQVEGLGMVVRTGVPVEHGALAGLDPEEIADPRPLAASIREAARQNGLDQRLGPKVSVVLDGGGHSGLGATAADIRLMARRHCGEISWTFAIAGDARTAKPLAVLPDGRAAQAAIAGLEAVAALGREGRGRDLDARRRARLAALLPPLVGAGSIAPALAGGQRLVPSILPLRGGASALAVAVPFGQMDADGVIGLAARAEEVRASEIRLAPGRIMLALCPADADATALRQEAGRLGFVISPDDPRAGISACPGAPACASGRMPARSLAALIAAAHGDILDGSLGLHVSGCAKGCANPAKAPLALVGGEDGAGLVVDGTARSVPLARVPAEHALNSFGRLAGLIRAERRPGETSAACVARLGTRCLAEAFEKG